MQINRQDVILSIDINGELTYPRRYNDKASDFNFNYTYLQTTIICPWLSSSAILWIT